MEEDDLELSFEDIVNAQAILGGADSDDSSSAAPTSTSASASAPSSAASDNGPAAAAPLARVVSRSGSGVLVLGGGSQLPESSTDDDDGLLGPPSAPVAVPTPAAAGDDDFARLLADGSDRSGRASPVSETEQYIARLSSSPRSGSHADLGDAGLPQQFPADTGSPRSPARSRSSSSGSNGVGSPLVSRKPSLTLLGVTQDDSNTETDTDAGLLSDAAAAAAAAAAVPASSAEAFLASVDPDDMAFDAVLSAAAAVAGSPRMPASPHDSPERELAVSVPKHLHFSDAFVSVPSADIDTDDPSLDIVVPVVQAKEDLTQHVSPPAASSLQRRGSSQDVHLRHMLAKRVASGDIDGAAAQEAEAAIQAERLAHELSNGVGGAAGPAYVEGRDNGSHAHFVNGNYVVKEGAIFDDRPVLVHEEAIPPGFADASGKHLHMYYHSENEAWAISTELGSLDVLAYILGDVFDKDFEPGSYGPVVWNVSNGHGDYEVDEHLVMRGSAVPPAVAQAFGFDSPTLPDAQVPAGAHAIPVDELAIATGAAMASSPVISPVTSPHELLHDFGESSTDDDESPVAAMRSGSQDNMAPSAAKVELIEPEAVSISRTEMFGPDSSSGMGPSSANPQHRRPPRNHIYEELPEPQQGGASLNDAAQGMRQRSQSFKEKAAAKIKSGAKRLKKSGLRGLGGRLTGSSKQAPVDKTQKLIEKFLAAEVSERTPIVAELQKVARKPLGPKDSLETLREGLLSIWRTLLRSVDKADVKEREMYFDTIIAIMVREELQIHTVGSSAEPWLKPCCNLLLLTHNYVVEKLSQPGMYEALLLFCAKALAINYFCIPGLASVIVRAVVRATPILNRRSRRLGSQVTKLAIEAQQEYGRTVPREKKVVFTSIHRVCHVNIGADSDQCQLTLPRGANRQPFSTVVTPMETKEVFEDWDASPPVDLTLRDLWGHVVNEGVWTNRFVTQTEAGFGFLNIFLEVLFRRCRAMYLYSFFKNKVDQKLGINERVIVATVFMPGFIELTSSFLRLALTSELALKRSFRIGAGPPSIVCNWTDRTAACALALSQNGLFFSCLIRDLMEQTSTSHVADVMALLGSLKALLESFDRMHEMPLPDEIDIDLVVFFVKQLLSCEHYVVIMFSLRWLYDCLDYFNSEHRCMIIDTLVRGDLLKRVLCHWEPSVRHLAHMLIIYRFFEPMRMVLQASFLQALVYQLEESAHKEPNFVPLSDQIFEDKRVDPKLNDMQKVQVHELRSFLWNIVQGHDVNSPPYAPEKQLPWKCAQHLEARFCCCKKPLHRQRYASESLEQLRQALHEGITWVKEHRFESASDELYPPILLSLPPLQNMTSAYVPKTGRVRSF